MLMADDCFLPHFEREISELCRSTPIINGDDELKSGRDRANRIYGTDTCGIDIKNGDTVEYRFDALEKINAVHVVFDSDLDRDTLPGDFCERGHVTRANVLLESPQMYPPKTLCKAFRLTALTENGEREILSVDTNRNRAYHVTLDEPVFSIRLTMSENWGATDATRLVSFDFC